MTCTKCLGYTGTGINVDGHPFCPQCAEDIRVEKELTALRAQLAEARKQIADALEDRDRVSAEYVELEGQLAEARKANNIHVDAREDLANRLEVYGDRAEQLERELSSLRAQLATVREENEAAWGRVIERLERNHAALKHRTHIPALQCENAAKLRQMEEDLEILRAEHSTPQGKDAKPKGDNKSNCPNCGRQEEVRFFEPRWGFRCGSCGCVWFRDGQKAPRERIPQIKDAGEGRGA